MSEIGASQSKNYEEKKREQRKVVVFKINDSLKLKSSINSSV